MDNAFGLLPPAASADAARLDPLILFLICVSGFMSLLIAATIVAFAVRYRRQARVNRSINAQANHGWLEATFITVPALVMAVMFAWGTHLYLGAVQAPADALQINVLGKQWMWKFQHPQGQREINELHVPVDRAVRLKMISEDVIHDLYVPAFRVKHDVVPGRYSTLWFTPTRAGEYHLFCSQYCGSKHSEMVGRVVVMSQSDYAGWLAGKTSNLTPQESGKRLYAQYRCGSCHKTLPEIGTCPPLEGIYNQRVPLADGTTVIADEAYLRESIVRPQAKIVAGYGKEPMPPFEGVLTEEGILDLIAYIKSLSPNVEKAAP